MRLVILMKTIKSQIERLKSSSATFPKLNEKEEKQFADDESEIATSILSNMIEEIIQTAKDEEISEEKLEKFVDFFKDHLDCISDTHAHYKHNPKIRINLWCLFVANEIAHNHHKTVPELLLPTAT